MARSRNWCTVVVLALCLAGCTAGRDNSARDYGARASPQIQVMSKSFTIAGPRGFCIDEDATHETNAGAVVILGSCAAISGNPNDAKPDFPAVLTASVAPALTPLDRGALDRMAAFFSSPDGRTALARSESTSTATVLDLVPDEGLLLVHASDGARTGDVAEDYWRGVFEANGKLVTVTASGFRATPMSSAAGERLARDFVAAIRRVNAGSRGTGTTNTGNTRAGGLASFFNRLL